MNNLLTPGTYIIAVSGGVDSIVLLDMLAHDAKLKLIVAHYEHGIRAESDEDRKLVEKAAAQYGYEFVCEHGRLGPTVSEAAAREKRYDFLHRVQERCRAQAIVTAHHEDDLLETIILNLLRGTGRRGMTSMQTNQQVLRPLLTMGKRAIYDYAREHSLTWHEDVTNGDDQYLRNYIRHSIVPRLGELGRAQLLSYASNLLTINAELDKLLMAQITLHSDADGLSRSWFVNLPYMTAREVLISWLRAHQITDFDRKHIAELTRAAMIYRPGKRADVNAAYFLKVGRSSLQLVPRFTS